MQIHALALIACAAAAAAAAPSMNDPETRPLFRFDDAASIDAWRPVHDRVMGGVSTGRPTWTGECARFAGELSLENNGGFASFRAWPEEALDLSGADGLRLRVRGDGRNWKVSLRTGQGRSDHNWQAPFQTRDGGEWQEVVLPFDAFAPSFHGRYARTEEPLDRASVESLGLQVADGQEGDYRLDVAAIEAWSANDEEAPPGSIAAHVRRTEFLATRLADGPTAETLVETLRWNERVLVVAEPLGRGDYGKGASIQRGRFTAEMDELAARDLRVVHLLGERATLAAGQQLGREATAALRERWELPASEWACVLVGKDGGVKERWDEPIAPEAAFAPIDRMPMRQREARERGTEH